MTSYLAPECLRPSSVVSENYFQRFRGYAMIEDEKKRCLFGNEYEREVCFYLSKHAEANCDDRVCLIGEESAWRNPIQERLYLNKMIHFIDCNSSANTIEEQLSTIQFDRIILFNCLHRINSWSISPINLLRRSLLPNGQLIIIYREPTMNTLPLPKEVMRKWLYKHMNDTRHIQQLYYDRIDIRQKIEMIQFPMNKFYWFSLLYHRKFYPLTLISQKQMIDELRQLNETYFKYHQGSVEIHDRLTFLIVRKIADSTRSSSHLIPRWGRKTFDNQ